MAHWGGSFAGAAHQLRLLTPDGKEQVLSFAGRADLKIGSARECDLVLEGPGIAPQHCRIEDRKGRLILFDRGSTAGTLINEKPCKEPVTLHEGDRITVGLYLLEVLPGRAHLGDDAIAEHLHFAAPGWSAGEATRVLNFITLL
ncbi:MAG TPA: FHA domain-containing protein, partial [Nannocystaceae bacterium]|nr:FHA domain-containing protein [Nannocystaceae bacterium]